MSKPGHPQTNGSEPVSRSILRPLVLLAVISSLSGPVWADASRLDVLITDYASISRDLHEAQVTQAALMKQKTALDAQGADLSKRQDALNQQADSHNSAAAEQQRQLAKSKSECNNRDYVDGKNTPQHIADCDAEIKKLNKQTQEVNAGVLPLETQQNSLDLEYSQYNQAANDWTVQEDRNTTALNALYRAINDWADRADDYMGSAPFLDKVQAYHANQTCAERNLPDGLLSIDELQHYAAGAERCLRYIASRRK